MKGGREGRKDGHSRYLGTGEIVVTKDGTSVGTRGGQPRGGAERCTTTTITTPSPSSLGCLAPPRIIQQVCSRAEGVAPICLLNRRH
ncbi:hypothetical protein E2C01_002327 [Portunus trituberculatus]|uniref:Uncharacterized protein n=1 Tax=Portunus trituberculatus TaxID=210409 RepID=A0A5B7CKP9_PORTR|nr:hypothetical protein [Portunus trituberculatus]